MNANILKDERKFLLNGALLALLLFSLTCVSAADDASQVVCENYNNDSSLDVEINNADVMEFNNTDDEIVIENVIRDVVVISNSTSAVCIVNSAINTIIIKNSEIYDFIIENSTIDSAIIEKSIIRILTVSNSTDVIDLAESKSVRPTPINASAINASNTTVGPIMNKTVKERAEAFRKECNEKIQTLELLEEIVDYAPYMAIGIGIFLALLTPLGIGYALLAIYAGAVMGFSIPWLTKEFISNTKYIWDHWDEIKALWSQYWQGTAQKGANNNTTNANI